LIRIVVFSPGSKENVLIVAPAPYRAGNDDSR
jgi:hypothetical protein